MSQKLKSVEDALAELFADTSVPAETTLAHLEGLQADIEGKIDALRCDLNGADE